MIIYVMFLIFSVVVVMCVGGVDSDCDWGGVIVVVVFDIV